ncbi:MAG: 4Fe-4S dicluster domain-containing protein [Candidatus Methanomethylophilaceae archaeon]|jgi:heterodisulfide reductase subunit C|nr:4Fe-4S dicluster domain-containing protein [Candidatus Methanomethylophilaceae archaeon]NCA73644.1 4Fe-4S dicluster domain-containing protein [Gammaproteobacteria bacterium]MDD2935706.1 4Fe-4S dicluster domain-containing protein [Candidatus Methanomethylophilaceae archaeon]MDD3351623.1 4Fe-4S dicluster domain-containing protein [Candidatus Methanomethylophilaceae archaeon]MDD3986899.1 4Fe-4S dicluster domain-containing protein [Candidatus Methanomethylophilaceae archaeon]
MEQGTLAEKFELERCIQCKKCTRNCPSAKHGGIVPNEAVLGVREGRYDGDPWTCLMCHRCSMVCPKGIEVAGLVLALRNKEAESGNIPERFRRVYGNFRQTGDTMSIAGSVDEERNSLGLTKICRGPEVPGKLEIMSGRGTQ